MKFYILIFLSIGLVSCGGGNADKGLSQSNNTTQTNQPANLPANLPTSGNSTLKLSWTAPTKNTDDSAITDINNYIAYYWSSNNPVKNSVAIPASSTSYTFTNLADNTTYFFALTTVNTKGQESSYSNTVQKKT